MCTAGVIIGIEPACLALDSPTPVSHFSAKGREHHGLQNSRMLSDVAAKLNSRLTTSLRCHLCYLQIELLQTGGQAFFMRANPRKDAYQLFFSITVSDTVTCRKIKGECAFLLCPLFKRATGTCYNGLAKCCRPLW
ncbi:beta-defensin 1 isoform 1-T1 [Morphnus guianensis]